MYDGELQFNKMHGHGKLSNKNGDVYEGTLFYNLFVQATSQTTRRRDTGYSTWQTEVRY